MDQCCEIQIEESGSKNVMETILQLLEKEDIENVRSILETNKTLLSYKGKDRKSLLHTVKYSLKVNYEIKRRILNMIIDVGYNLFTISENSSFDDNCQAIYFAAAKGDFHQLCEILQYFENDKTKLHDTREGDTVLSFMIKFGDCISQDFSKCLQLLMEQGIDVKRIDYYKKNVKEVICQEITFLKTRKIDGGFIEALNAILDIIENNPQIIDPKINLKYKLFESVMNLDNNFTALLNQDMLDSDDGENTLLQIAIIKNNFEATKELLQKGANPNSAVKGRNEEVPLVLSAKLARDKIFKEILKARNVEITQDVFATLVKETKSKFLNYLLESQTLNVDIEYKGKTPLFYAIKMKNKAAIQLLIQRGSRIDKNCLEYINPKDLEDYLNSCIRSDTFSYDTEERYYKFLLVFDFFINSCRKVSRPKANTKCHDEFHLLSEEDENNVNNFDTEIKVIRYIGNTKRLKHLLEHPLIYIYIILKWQCVKQYYILFVSLKLSFYIAIDFLLYNAYFKFPIILLTLLQIIVVAYNFRLLKIENKQHILQCFLETCLFILLVAICFLHMLSDGNTDSINQISAFIFIITSINILLTIGYNIIFSKWMAMVKRVFTNFTKLLLLFMLPIIAFAAAFKLLLPIVVERSGMEDKNEDFSSFPRSLFRTIIMMGGDMGDKKFPITAGYIIFLLFTVGIVIILLNFWTGIAVSDINKIEEQSTIMAFKYVIVFIENTERMYQLIYEKCLSSQTNNILVKWIKPPLLKSRIVIPKPKSERKSKKYTFQYGIELFINSKTQFRNKPFKNCKIDNDIISKIKTLSEKSEENLGQTLKEVLAKLNKIEMLLQRQGKCNH